MRIRLNPAVLGLMVVVCPVAALADLPGTVTLSANTALSLDTGATSASGGDILWSGSAMTPQSKATAYTNSAVSGASTFALLTQSLVSTFAPLYTNAPIPASTLVTGAIFAVHTNGGNYAAVLVTAVSGTSISLQFTTFGVNSGPTITLIENNYGEIPPGFANSGIAQGALFFIVGTGLSSSTPPLALQNPTVGLPTTLNGATVKVTVGGTSVTPAFYYAEPIALGLVLPSNTPTGAGTVTVTYNNQTSNSYSINVVQSAFGFDAYFGAGTGMAVAVFTFGTPAGGGCAQPSIACYTLSIPPGTQIELYGAGLGADLAIRDTTTSYNNLTPGINGLAHIYIGGVDAPISYQGPSGFPGLDQINITVPANVPTGCNVSLVGVTAAGVPTNFLTLPIGSGTCTDPVYGTSGTQLQTQSGQTTSTSGGVFLEQLTAPPTGGGAATTTGAAFAAFDSYTYSAGLAGSAGVGQVSIPGCLVTQSTTGSTGTSTSTGLDAGSVISLTGPSGAVSLPDSISEGGSTFTEVGSYFASPLPTGYIPTTGGTFTFKGTGGANVGPFTASVIFPNPVLSWTNQAAAATVTRSAGLPVQWSGGASGTYVIMSGSASSTATSVSGSFTCIAAVSSGQFTVPAYVLSAMPAGTGTVTVENSTVPHSFTATGINSGIALGFVATQVSATFN